MPRPNNVILIQVDVQKHDDLKTILYKIDVGLDEDNRSYYLSRVIKDGDVCE